MCFQSASVVFLQQYRTGQKRFKIIKKLCIADEHPEIGKNNSFSGLIQI